MGRGNLEKRLSQASNKGRKKTDLVSNIGHKDLKRERPNRDQPQTLPVDVHGMRGWNRTAGSRYEFAADGVTFESSGGI